MPLTFVSEGDGHENPGPLTGGAPLLNVGLPSDLLRHKLREAAECEVFPAEEALDNSHEAPVFFLRAAGLRNLERIGLDLPNIASA